MSFYLDEALSYLGLELPGAIDVLLVRAGETRAALLFRDPERAREHLPKLPGRTVHRVPADDFRAKEELLRAALHRGATEVWVDTAAEGLGPAARYPLREALLYVLSMKRQTACL